jgi:hypothetical protein
LCVDEVQSAREYDCHRAPLLNTKVSGNDIDASIAGTTDRTGKVRISFVEVPPERIRSMNALELSVDIRGRASPLHVDVDAAMLGALAANVAGERAERAWSTLRKSPSASAADFRTYAESYADWHHDEALAAFTARRLLELRAGVLDALAKRDEALTTKLIQEWAQLDSSSPDLKADQQRLQELSRDLRIETAKADLEGSLAAIEKKENVDTAIASATSAIDVLKSLDYGGPDLKQKSSQLEKARLAHVRAALSRARSLMSKGEYDQAVAEVDHASAVMPDSKEAAALRLSLERKEKETEQAEERRRQAEADKQERDERQQGKAISWATGRYRFETFDAKTIVDEPQQRCGAQAHPGGYPRRPRIGGLKIVVTGRPGRLRATLNGREGQNIEERESGLIGVTWDFPDGSGDVISYNVWFGDVGKGQAYAAVAEIVTWHSVRCVFGEWESDGTLNP